MSVEEADEDEEMEWIDAGRDGRLYTFFHFTFESSKGLFCLSLIYSGSLHFLPNSWPWSADCMQGVKEPIIISRALHNERDR